MGRFGKLPVLLPEGVSVEVRDSVVEVVGPKGKLKLDIPIGVSVKKNDDGELSVGVRGSGKQARAMQGTTRSHLANMVQGVSVGWSKQMEINGPGYRGEVRGQELHLSIGYSHPVIIPAPEGVSLKIEKNVVTAEGADKQMVGQVAAKVRDARRPNVYTGAGISYVGEQVRRKAGKQTAGGE